MCKFLNIIPHNYTKKIKDTTSSKSNEVYNTEYNIYIVRIERGVTHTKGYVKKCIRYGVEVEISYLESGILFFWNFSDFGHNLSLGILTEMTTNNPS